MNYPIRHRRIGCSVRLTKSVHSISPPSMAADIAIKYELAEPKQLSFKRSEDM